MTKYVLVLLLLLSPVLFAQEDSTNFSFPNHSFQFSVEPNFTLGSFNHSFLSYKYHYTNNHSIRTSLSTSSSKDNVDRKYGFIENDSLTGISDSERDDISFYITSQWLYYFQPDKQIKLFAGVGPFFSYRKSSIDEFRGVYDEQRNNSSTSESINMGLLGSIGVEWFFHDYFSLHVESSLQASYYTYDSLVKSIRNDPDIFSTKAKYKADGFDYGTGVTKFGLSVYF